MRIEFGQQGVYQIRPTSPINRTTPTSGTTPAQRSDAPGAINRAHDTLELSQAQTHTQTAAPRFNQHDISVEQLAQFRTRVSELVAGEVDQPVSFGPPRSPMIGASNNLYHRAYLKHSADYASLNAAAIEREQRQSSALDVRI